MHLVERLLDLQQFGRHRQQLLLVGALLAIDDVAHGFDLGLDQLPLRAEADHRQRIRDDVHLLRQVLELFDLREIAVDVDFEGRLDRFDIRLHRLGDGLEQRLVGAGDVVEHFAAGALRRQELLEPVGGLDRLGLGAVAFGLGDVIEEILDQLDRLALHQPALADDQDHAKQRVDLAEQILDRHAELELLARHRLDQRADDPPDARHLLRDGPLLEGFANLFEAREAFLDRLVLDDVEQCELVDRAQLLGEQLRRLVLLLVDGLGLGAFLVHRQVRQEQQLFREQILVAHRANVVEQRQDRDRDIAMAGLDMLEVIGQLQHRAQHDLERRFALLLLLLDDEIGERDHFLGQHRRAVLLDHHEHALDQPQAFLDRVQQRVVRRLDIALEIDFDLGQVVVDRLLDPAERAVLDRGFLRVHGSRRYSASSTRPIAARSSASCARVLSTDLTPGSLKPATDFCIS